MIEPFCSTHFLIGAAQIGAHARDAIGGPARPNALVTDELRDVVGLHGTVEANRAQLAHDPIHVQVAVIGDMGSLRSGVGWWESPIGQGLGQAAGAVTGGELVLSATGGA